MQKCRFQLQPRHCRQTVSETKSPNERTSERLLGPRNKCRTSLARLGIIVVAHAWFGWVPHSPHSPACLGIGIWHPWMATPNPPVAAAARSEPTSSVVGLHSVDGRRVYKYFWSSLQTSVQLTISCS